MLQLLTGKPNYILCKMPPVFEPTSVRVISNIRNVPDIGNTAFPNLETFPNSEAFIVPDIGNLNL
jgi:hypothetical protein